MSEFPLIDYPKTDCPFVRFTNEKGEYVVRDEISPGFEWVFESGVRATDKLHGTNLCVHIKNKEIVGIDNRATRLYFGGPVSVKGNSGKFLMGVMNAGNRGWLDNGSHYGELIGPDINGNLHQTGEYLFVPFSRLYDGYHWNTWVQNKYPKTFESISEWFKELPSLFSKKCLKKDVLAEGLVFYHPDGRRAKLRRDMFEWFYERNREPKPPEIN